MPIINTLLPNITSILLLLTFIILLPELTGNPETIKKYLHFPSSLLLYYTASSTIIFRLFNTQPISPWFTTILKLIFPISLFISVTLSIAEFITSPNYIYNIIPLNADKFFYVALLSFIYLLIQKKNSFFKDNYQRLILYSPLLLLFILFIVSLWPFDRFAQIVKEDQVIEYAQFFVLLIGSIFAFLISKHFLKNKKVYLFIIFVVLSLGLFATAGDEISWGQRLLGIATPEKLKELNTQGETGIHNLIYFDGLVPYAYILISFYGMISHLLTQTFKKLISIDTLRFFIPGDHLFFLFLFPFIYNFYTSLGDHHIGKWSEVAELYLYLGVCIFLSECYFKFIKSQNNT